MSEGERGVSFAGVLAGLGAFSSFSFLGFEGSSVAAVVASVGSAVFGLLLPTTSFFC